MLDAPLRLALQAEPTEGERCCPLGALVSPFGKLLFACYFRALHSASSVQVHKPRCQRLPACQTQS